MLDAVQESVPDAQLYIESILPISVEKEKVCADNSKIIEFNKRLEGLADEKNIVYVDLYQLYELNGYMNPKLTKDGIHLLDDAYEYWFRTIENYINE